MRISEIVEIVQGQLLNKPSIVSAEQIITDLSKVQKGDLFISDDKNAISQALQQGAYAIISSLNLEVDSEDEVAFILVENISESIMRLIRYKLLVQHIKLILLQGVDFAIAKEIIYDERARFLSTQNAKSSLEQMLNLLDEQATFLIVDNKDIAPLSFEVIELDKTKQSSLITISSNLFDSTIFYEGTQFRINIPSMFLNNLSSIIYLCNQNEINLRLDRFHSIPFFRPNFISAFGTLSNFGQTSKVAIAEKDIEIFKKYMAYIANNATWGKIIFIVPSIYVDIFEQIAQTFSYEDTEEICKCLRKEKFNFALILGIDDDSLVNAFNSSVKEQNWPTLFES